MTAAGVLTALPHSILARRPEATRMTVDAGCRKHAATAPKTKTRTETGSEHCDTDKHVHFKLANNTIMWLPKPLSNRQWKKLQQQKENINKKSQDASSERSDSGDKRASSDCKGKQPQSLQQEGPIFEKPCVQPQTPVAKRVPQSAATLHMVTAAEDIPSSTDNGDLINKEDALPRTPSTTTPLIADKSHHTRQRESSCSECDDVATSTPDSPVSSATVPPHTAKAKKRKQKRRRRTKSASESEANDH